MKPAAPATRSRLFGTLSLLVPFILAAAALALYGPIPQNPAFHLFADQRTCLGIAHFGNVLSNLGFAVAGLIGVGFLCHPAGLALLPIPAQRRTWLVFFAGVALVSAGSAYYHAAPDTPRLFWDRLPMTVAFMALFTGFIADRITPARFVLPLLVGLGAASVVYWRWSESIGQGDLRPYALVQFFPMVALPLICWLFPRGRVTSFRHLCWLLAWYWVAMMCEAFDHQIFALLDGTVSGHSIKHLLAAMAPLVVLRMLWRTPPARDSFLRTGR